MKKKISTLLILTVALAMGACGKTETTSVLSETETVSTPEPTATKVPKKETTSTPEPTEEVVEETTSTPEPTEEVVEAPVAETDNGDIRSDVKEAIDSYEAWVDKYCDFMKNYDSSDLSKLSEATELISEEATMLEKFDSLENDLNEAELQYYLEVQTRCTQKLSEIAS